MTSEALRRELTACFRRALEDGAREIEVSSWELHRRAHGDVSTDDDIQTCCAVLKDEQCVDDEIVHRSADGQSPPSVTIRYQLPR